MSLGLLDDSDDRWSVVPVCVSGIIFYGGHTSVAPRRVLLPTYLTYCHHA